MREIGLYRPEPHELSSLPSVGAPAPSGPPLDALRGMPGLVAFLRHPGCPCAERSVRALRRLASRTVIVLHGEPDHADSWLASIGGAGALAVVHDRDRLEYARWGIGLTDTRHFLSMAPLLSVVRGWSDGVRNRDATGTRYQQAATFAVDEHSIVRWRQLASHGGELPDFGVGLSALLAAEQDPPPSPAT